MFFNIPNYQWDSKHEITFPFVLVCLVSSDTPIMLSTRQVAVFPLMSDKAPQQLSIS